MGHCYRLWALTFSSPTEQDEHSLQSLTQFHARWTLGSEEHTDTSVFVREVLWCFTVCTDCLLCWRTLCWGPCCIGTNSSAFFYLLSPDSFFLEHHGWPCQTMTRQEATVHWKSASSITRPRRLTSCAGGNGWSIWGTPSGLITPCGLISHPKFWTLWITDGV
jgi:hypothetical protein